MENPKATNYPCQYAQTPRFQQTNSTNFHVTTQGLNLRYRAQSAHQIKAKRSSATGENYVFKQVNKAM